MVVLSHRPIGSMQFPPKKYQIVWRPNISPTCPKHSSLISVMWILFLHNSQICLIKRWQRFWTTFPARRKPKFWHGPGFSWLWKFRLLGGISMLPVSSTFVQCYQKSIIGSKHGSRGEPIFLIKYNKTRGNSWHFEPSFVIVASRKVLQIWGQVFDFWTCWVIPELLICFIWKGELRFRALSLHVGRWIFDTDSILDGSGSSAIMVAQYYQ